MVGHYTHILVLLGIARIKHFLYNIVCVLVLDHGDNRRGPVLAESVEDLVNKLLAELAGRVNDAFLDHIARELVLAHVQHIPRHACDDDLPPVLPPTLQDVLNAVYTQTRASPRTTMCDEMCDE